MSFLLGRIVMLKVLKNYRFSIILLLSVLIGGILGAVLGPKATVLQPFADVFLNMVFCLITPLVFISISNSIASMTNLKRLGKILGTILGVVIITGLISAVLALVSVHIFDPAAGVHVQLTNSFKPTDADTTINFVNLFTVSSFVDLLSLKNMMALIVFAILFGVSVSSIGEIGEPVAKLLNSLTETLTKFVSIVMLYAPIGIACYFAALIGKMGGQIIVSVVRLSIIYSVFCVLYIILFHSCCAYFGGGAEGLKRYWRNIWMPLTTAAGTCSSSACLPVNMVAARKMGIPKDIRQITIPLASSIHKDGVVIVQIMKIVFLFGILGLNFTPDNIPKAILVALISGIIVGTIPSGGFIGEMFICTAFGLPTSVIPIIVIMGTITDPFCTSTSVTSQTAICMVMARLLEGKDWVKRKLSGEGDEDSSELAGEGVK